VLAALVISCASALSRCHLVYAGALGGIHFVLRIFSFLKVHACFAKSSRQIIETQCCLAMPQQTQMMDWTGSLPRHPPSERGSKPCVLYCYEKIF
jgi:hypothetical protein